MILDYGQLQEMLRYLSSISASNLAKYGPFRMTLQGKQAGIIRCTLL
jgi:hypothetical protein